jgi:NAD(P)-dependent dehydrogenase (short-subunit alcohol dehydrogenase family)
MRQVVLITGVVGGIGQATATLFSKNGWYVVGIDKMPDYQGDNIDFYVQADIYDPEQISISVAHLSQQVDRLNALINNAAVQICKPIMETSVAEWDQVMAVNVRAAFLFSQACYSLLKQSQGSIVNISSVHAIVTSANIAGYAASKGALTAFTRAQAIEFAVDKIRVNAVLPGAVDTPMLRAGLERGHLSATNIEDLMSQLGEKTVMGRIGNPQEIAQAIIFLADNQKSSFMTGQTLVVDGGATARLSTE